MRSRLPIVVLAVTFVASAASALEKTAVRDTERDWFASRPSTPTEALAAWQKYSSVDQGPYHQPLLTLMALSVMLMATH